MPFVIQATLEGDRELIEKLKRLESLPRETAFVSAMEATMAPLESEMIARIPGSYEKLRASIGTEVRHYRQSGVTLGMTGPTWPAGWNGHLVERGAAHRRTQKGHYRGSVEPHPFVEPTYQANKDTLEQRLAGELRNVIERRASG